jgi:hypothetical protein
MTTAAPKPLRIFCSYSHKDEEYLNVLRAWLRGLERRGQITWWHDREIVPGWEWEEAIDKNLRTADIIFLLVTPDFMASDYVFEREIDRAIERHERGEARVIPIIVRPALWKGTSLDRLQALPKDAKPITRWPDRDEAWLDVTEGIQRAIEELLVERRERAVKERYRKVVEEAWADTRVSVTDAEQLDALASELDLSTDTVSDIERDVMGDTKEAILERQEQAAAEDAAKQRYREAVEEAWANQKVSSEEAERLGGLAGALGLSTDTAADIEREVMGDTVETNLVRQEDAAREEERNRRLEELYAQARQLHGDRMWQAVIDVFERIRAEDPAYPDREDLLASAREALEAQELTQRVAAVYAEGQRHMDAGEWQQALERFEEVQRLEPGYQDTEELLSQVRQELAPPSTVEVPDLSGQEVSQVGETLASKGLKLGFRSEGPSNTVSKGRIIEQSPTSGTEVDVGTSVDVKASSGSSTIEDPDLAGRRAEWGGRKPRAHTPSPGGTRNGAQNGGQPGRRVPVWLVAVATVFLLALLGIAFLGNGEEQGGNQQGKGGQPAGKDRIYDSASVLSDTEEQQVQDAFDQAQEETGKPFYVFLVPNEGVEGQAARQDLLTKEATEAQVPQDAGVVVVATNDGWGTTYNFPQDAYNTMVPDFQEGDFAAGLMSGAREIQG